MLPGSYYHGLSELSFNLISIPKELAVCLRSKDVKKVEINGKLAELVQEDEDFVMLEVGKLREGANNVAILYTNRYDNDGSGCVSFIDVDSEQYIYTQFESYFAHRVVACF